MRFLVNNGYVYAYDIIYLEKNVLEIQLSSVHRGVEFLSAVSWHSIKLDTYPCMQTGFEEQVRPSCWKINLIE